MNQDNMLYFFVLHCDILCVLFNKKKNEPQGRTKGFTKIHQGFHYIK